MDDFELSEKAANYLNRTLNDFGNCQRAYLTALAGLAKEKARADKLELENTKLRDDIKRITDRTTGFTEIGI